MSDTILEIRNFSKTFRSHWTFRPILAVCNVSLSVNRGESFGFLGHNGAGKTTTIKSAVGLIHKTSGEILIDGEDSSHAAQHKKFGYLPEHPYFYDHLTVEEMLDFFATLQEIKNPERKKRVIDTLERVGLGDRRKSSVRSLSKGLQQRLGFAQAIINDPPLLLLDEPFSGLDPIGRMEIRNLILELKKKGTTIFLSSHILSDVEDICDRVSIMAHGELLEVFSLADSSSRFGESFKLTLRGEAQHMDALKALKKLADGWSEEALAIGSVQTFHFDSYGSATTALNHAAEGPHKIETFERKGMSLEEIFVKITEADGKDTDATENNPRGDK